MAPTKGRKLGNHARDRGCVSQVVPRREFACIRTPASSGLSRSTPFLRTTCVTAISKRLELGDRPGGRAISRKKEDVLSIRTNQVIWIACIAILLALPTNVSALEFGYCGEDAQCVCEGYDSCAEFDMNELIDSGDPDAIRDAYGIQTEWNSEKQVLESYVEPQFVEARVLPVNPNRGNWESLDDLNDYINTMMGVPDGHLCDLCNPLTCRMQTRTSGFYGRWDSQEGEWAERQRGGFIFDAVSGPNGELTVNGIDVGRIIPDPQCSAAQDGNLGVAQCSFVGMSVTEHMDRVCEDRDDWQGGRLPIAGTRIDEVAWNGKTSGLYKGESTMFWGAVQPDWLELDGRYYDDSGNWAEDDDNSRNYRRATEKIDSLRRHGTCGWGDVERSIYQVNLVTRAGTAPSVCPEDPF